MARSVRIQYPGAVYHVMCRGDRREPIFMGDHDRFLMIETLEDTCTRTGFLIHSYVLMPNHYHFLIETPEPNLVAGMKWFQGTYTQRFNCRNGVCGHLFQGRYKAIPIETDDPSYFRTVSDYIHLNPARAGMLEGNARKLEAFSWSSFPAFIGKSALPDWLIRERVFSHHGLQNQNPGCRQRYAAVLARRAREIMEDGESEEQLAEREEFRRGWYIGGDEFRSHLLECAAAGVQGSKRESFRREGMARHDEQAARRLLEASVSCLDVSISVLRSRRQTDPIKQAVAWWVKSRSVVGDEWICRQLQMGSRTNVHRAVAAYRQPSDAVRTKAKAELELCAD